MWLEYPVAYNIVIAKIRQTEDYARWFRRLSLGNPGDVRAVGEGVSETRIDYGPGYRVYFVRRGEALIVLLTGQSNCRRPPKIFDVVQRDIRRALELDREL